MSTAIMSRPQVSIDRLTPRRVMAEPRESMNCKSCRKRKVRLSSKVKRKIDWEDETDYKSTDKMQSRASELRGL